MTDRYNQCANTIKDIFTYFPPGLDRIILDYYSHDFESKDIVFDKVHSHDFIDLDKLDNPMDFPLESDVWKKLICCVIESWDGTLISGSYSGEIIIWDPMTGKCLKKINLLEDIFIVSKEKNPQMLEICQISNDWIAITHHNTHHGAYNDIYLININESKIQKINTDYPRLMFNGREHKQKTHNMFLSSHNTNSLILLVNNSIKKWIIYSENENIDVRCTFETIYEHNVKYMIMSPDKNILIAWGQNEDREIVESINVHTHGSVKKIFHSKEFVFLRPHIVNDYLIVCQTDKRTFNNRYYALFDPRTLSYLRELRELDNKKIETMIGLKNNYMAAIEKGETNDNILIMDLEKGVCTQIIETERLRGLAKSKNGFVTVGVHSEILFYDYV